MNSLMFDSHNDDPHRIVKCDGQGKIVGFDEGADDVTGFIAIGFHCGGCRPIVMRFVQIIPRHFVNTDGQC